LNGADLNTPDGTGILWASKYLKIVENNKSKTVKIFKWIFSLLTIPFYPKYIRTEFKDRVTGSDMMLNICKSAEKSGVKLFFLGAREGIAKKVKQILEKKYKKINVVGTYSGTPMFCDEKGILDRINKSEADILFVAYGAPAQEMWIARNLKKMRTVKVAIGVGGSFDFLAGTKKRAPKWMQKIGLEWLYRLIQQPSRVKRIFNATIKFPCVVLKDSLRG
jgi:N-acetylglucosaminyldiphosphoundecaprenol N-acetyl-beta-D-mannosaminyltransferase